MKTDSEILQNAFQLISNSIHELEDIIHSKLGEKIELNVNYHGHGHNFIRIDSGDLINNFNNIGKYIFNEIMVQFWDGTLTSNKKKIRFKPRLYYYVHQYCSVPLIWNTLYFEIETGKWIEGSLVKK